jgi:hypothetical protein
MIKQAEPEYFRVVVVGNYVESAAPALRAALTQKLMFAKNRVHPQPVVVLLPPLPTSVSALAARVAKSLRLSTKVEPQLEKEEYRNGIELVILAHVLPGEGTPDEVADDLETSYGDQTDPWSENERVYELKLPVGPVMATPRQTDLAQPKLPEQPEAPTFDYSDIDSPIEEWKKKAFRESTEVVHDRSKIPAYGPGIPANGDMAGGQQQSSLQVAADWTSQLKALGFQQSPHTKGWFLSVGDLGNGHARHKIQVRKIGGPAIGEPEQWQVSTLGFALNSSSGRAVLVGTGEPEAYDSFAAALKYIKVVISNWEKRK